MTILSLPFAAYFARSSFGLESNTQAFKSPLTGQMQTLERPGARWQASYTLPPMKRQKAALWQAFLLKLRGGAGRFYAFDPDGVAPRGAALMAAGGAKVDGALQSGTQLATKNWQPSQAGVLKAGDYVAYDTSLGRTLHLVTQDASSDALGKAVLLLEPPLRTAPADGAMLIVQQASCVMALVEASVAWEVDAQGVYKLSFSAEERF